MVNNSNTNGHLNHQEVFVVFENSHPKFCKKIANATCAEIIKSQDDKGDQNKAVVYLSPQLQDGTRTYTVHMRGQQVHLPLLTAKPQPPSIEPDWAHLPGLSESFQQPPTKFHLSNFSDVLGPPVLL